MFRARLVIRLPSSAVKRSAWLRRRFDVDGFEGVTTPSVGVVRGVFGALAAAGVSDALSLRIDGRSVFVDALDVPGDLDGALEAALDAGVGEREFGQMQLVTSTVVEGLQFLFDLSARHETPAGEPALVVEVSARPEVLHVRRGERADAYVQRVFAYSASPAALRQRRGLDTLVHRLGHEIATHLVCTEIVAETARIELRRPEPKTVRSFARLGFGERVAWPLYQPIGFWREDPFDAYHPDRYWEFTSFLLLENILRHRHLRSPHVWILDDEGYLLASGENPSAAADAWVPTQALSYGLGVSVEVDEVVAEAWLAGREANSVAPS